MTKIKIEPTKELGQLSPKQERYVRARVTGNMKPLEAMRWAGYTLNDQMSENTLIKKALKFDQNPFLQTRMADVIKKENMHNVAKKLTTVVDAIASFNPERVTLPQINSGAMATFRAALQVDNFSAALSCLKFIAETNGIVDIAKGGPRQQRNRKNEAEAVAAMGADNHEFNTDDGAEDTGAEEYSLFDDSSASVGAVHPKQEAARNVAPPHLRKRDQVPEAEPEVDVDDSWYSEPDERDDGPPREDGGQVS